MEPITRKEIYLAIAAGLYSGSAPSPITREEHYLGAICGSYSGTLPEPVTRLDRFMAYAAGAYTGTLPTPITRKEIYWAAICGVYESDVPEPITREEYFLSQITGGSAYTDATASGTVIELADSAAKALNSLALYGRSTQDGTPSPEEPIEIVNAGYAMSTGAQLWNPEAEDYYVNGYRLMFERSANTDYTLSTNETVSSLAAFTDAYNGTTIIVSYSSKQITFNSGDLETVYLQAYAPTNKADVNVMLNEGTSALDYEPYTGGEPGVYYPGSVTVTLTDGGSSSQTLVLTASNGLPGIPVSSGGNYTDENGQMWVADEIVLNADGSGTYVQRIATYTTSSSTSVGTIGSTRQTDSDYFGVQLASTFPKAIENMAMMCDKLVYAGIGQAITGHQFTYVLSNGIVVYGLAKSLVEEETADAVKAYIVENPLTFKYIAASATETDLTAEEVAAFLALTTYDGTTVISNDAEAYMEVGYKAKG